MKDGANAKNRTSLYGGAILGMKAYMRTVYMVLYESSSMNLEEELHSH